MTLPPQTRSKFVNKTPYFVGTRYIVSALNQAVSFQFIH